MPRRLLVTASLVLALAAALGFFVLLGWAVGIGPY